MTKETDKITKAGAVELKEEQLDQTVGGVTGKTPPPPPPSPRPSTSPGTRVIAVDMPNSQG